MTFRDTSADTTLDEANMGIKEDFEKWARRTMFDIEKFRDGSYSSISTRSALEGYESRQPEIDALKEKIAGGSPREVITLKTELQLMVEQRETLWKEIDALKAENERLRSAIPNTPEAMMTFIGSHFNGMRTGDSEGQTYTDLSRVEYWLTIHDLLSAFSWAGLGPEEINAAMKDFSTTQKEDGAR